MVTWQDSSNIAPPLDYVDDSEPERKRIKLQTVETKRQRKYQKQPRHQNTDVAHAHDSPPTGGDTISLKGLGGVTAGTTLDVIENAVSNIICDTKRSCSKPSSKSQSQVPLEISRPQALLASAPKHVPSSGATDTEEVSSESNLVACLGHLAYKQVRRPSTNMSDSSRAECRQSASTLQIHHNKVGSLGQGSVPNSSVTKRDVGPLLGCVSCGVWWTVKKSAAHKLSHITTCARKKGINPTTLRLLVERELLKIRQTKTNDKEATSCSDSTDAVSQTYMECVVAEAQPKRKQRRTDAAGTLQPVSQTRAAILDRAKALLGAWGAMPGDAPEPEHTQSFGRSKLATGYMQTENVDPTASHPFEECALTSRLAILRSMAGSPATSQPRGCE